MLKSNRPLYLFISTLTVICASWYLLESYLNIRHQQHIDKTSQALFSDLLNLRQTAIGGHKIVSICARSDNACQNNTGNWNQGWIAYKHSPRCQPNLTLSSDCILLTNKIVINTEKLAVKANIAHFSFNQDGVLASATQNIHIEICANATDKDLHGKALRISEQGHIRLISEHQCQS